MEDAIRNLTEIAEHLAYSHTFRSEHVQRRVHSLLRDLRARLDATPSQDQEQEDQEQEAGDAA